ncbi:hypothetical protein ES703_27516 [subsurface metagenome]
MAMAVAWALSLAVGIKLLAADIWLKVCYNTPFGKSRGVSSSEPRRHRKVPPQWVMWSLTFAEQKKVPSPRGGFTLGKQEGLFRVAGNNWGLACPFEPIVCRRGYCDFCEIYHDWQKLGEIIVICAWCSQVIDRKPGLGKPVVSHGICRECVQKYFPETTSRDTKSRRGILRKVKP